MLAVAPADLAKLPATPGVYLLVDARGRLLYIGRASSLRSRVRSYWSAGLDRPGLRRMVRRVRRVLAGSCVSEHEAALLERTLLERHCFVVLPDGTGSRNSVWEQCKSSLARLRTRGGRSRDVADRDDVVTAELARRMTARCDLL